MRRKERNSVAFKIQQNVFPVVDLGGGTALPKHHSLDDFAPAPNTTKNITMDMCVRQGIELRVFYVQKGA